MYGSPTTKESKKKHSPRPVGGAEMGSQVERTRGKTMAGGPRQARKQLVLQGIWWLVEQAVPHLHASKPGGTTETDCINQVSRMGK